MNHNNNTLSYTQSGMINSFMRSSTSFGGHTDQADGTEKAAWILLVVHTFPASVSSSCVQSAWQLIEHEGAGLTLSE